jgi:hypothetical protein
MIATDAGRVNGVFWDNSLDSLIGSMIWVRGAEEELLEK